MTWEPLASSWREVDVNVADLWAASGAQWLTSPGVAVPSKLVRSLAGIVEMLDERGAGLEQVSTARGVGLVAERAAAVGLMPSSDISCGGASRLLQAADGWLAVSLARDADVEMVPAWLDLDGGAVPADRLWNVVADEVADRAGVELEERAALLGLPVALVGHTAPRAAGCAVRVDRRGHAPPSTVEGLVVVNLASLWAGPLCADVLARLGADVITVESTGRPDGARRTQRFFESLHGRSRSVALDLGEAGGRRRLRELLQCADIVIEGSRPRALEQMGVHAQAVLATGPRVWASITAHGRDLPHGLRTGFGDDAAVAGGLVGRVGDRPVFLADAIGDPVGGLVAAASVIEVVERGGRCLIDVSLAHAAASMVTVGEATVGPSDVSARPSTRRDPGGPMPLGRDTDEVLRQFGLR